MPDRQGVCDVCEVLPRGDPQGVLLLAAGPDVDGALLAEARMVVIQHPVHVIGTSATLAFTEFRLLNAVRR
jgi:hypothetical protein